MRRVLNARGAFRGAGREQQYYIIYIILYYIILYYIILYYINAGPGTAPHPRRAAARGERCGRRISFTLCVMKDTQLEKLKDCLQLVWFPTMKGCGRRISFISSRAAGSGCAAGCGACACPVLACDVIDLVEYNYVTSYYIYIVYCIMQPSCRKNWSNSSRRALSI